MTGWRNPLCVALDELDPAANERLADAVAPEAGLLKLGLTGFAAGGPELARSLAVRVPLFLDLKFHDIPTQVEGAVRNVARLGATLTNVHAAGGADMIKAAVAGGGDDVAVLAVTVLTSLDGTDLDAIGLAGPPVDAVLRLAELALDAGAAGLVCSPLEVAALRARFGTVLEGGPTLVVPGVRRTGAEAHDQRRTLTAKEAVEAGGDVMVVGRPITSSPDPRSAAASLALELSS